MPAAAPAPGPGPDEARGQTAQAAHARAFRGVPRRIRPFAKLAAVLAVPALLFSGLGWLPPRVDAVPVQAAAAHAVVVVATAGAASSTGATSSPGATAIASPSGDPTAGGPSDIPPGDDSGPDGFPAGVPGAGPNASGSVPASDPSAASTTPPATVVGGAVISYRGPPNRRVVALTFDDGYNPTALHEIFATLVANHVKATFFVNGMYLSRAPALWRQIAAAGFPVGNHTYHHVDIRRLTAARLARELKMTDDAWHRLTGAHLIPYFRPPYGYRDALSVARAAADGYPNIVMWSNSVADTAPATTVASGTAAALRAGPGGIILLHVGPALTPQLLQGVIDGFRARGFEFVTIPELLGR